MMNSSSLSRLRLALYLQILFSAFMAAAYYSPLTFVIGIAAVSAGAMGLLALSKLKNECTRTTQICTSLAQGDFEKRLTGITEDGTIGELMWAVNDLADHVDAFIRESTASMQYVSQNQYFRTILEKGLHGAALNGAKTINTAMKNVEAKMSDFSNVAHGVDSSLSLVGSDLKLSISDLKGMTDTMSEIIVSVRQGSENAIRFSSETAQNVQNISAAAEQMSSSIAEISQQMNRTSQIARKASDTAENSTALIQTLAETSENIGKVVSLIQDIADQTNLLALNATIEAARAGDAGKGFAVVASEVKELSGQTASATEDIAKQIQNIQHATDGAVQAFSEIGSIVKEINESTAIIASAIEEQNAAFKEIAHNAEKSYTGTDQVAANVNEMGQSIGQIDESCKQVCGVAERLACESSSKVEELLKDMGRFMTELKKIA